jgi:hypothetical protein
VPVFQVALGTVPLTPGDWLVAFGLALPVFGGPEVRKWLATRRARPE